MGQRILKTSAIVLSMLCIDSVVRAQESRPPSGLFPSIGVLAPATPQRADAVEPELFAPRFEAPISPNTGMPSLDAPQEARTYPLVESALRSGEWIDCRYAANSLFPDEMGVWERTRVEYGEQFHRLHDDARHFYCGRNLIYVGIAVAVAAPLANTRVDQRVNDWYGRRDDRYTTSQGEVARIFKYFGDYRYTVPFLVGASMTGHLFGDHFFASPFAEFGDRSLRALAIGAPTVGVLQLTLGSSRPHSGDSHWHPFRHSNAVSGHTFVGAVPFLTAASMVENRALKALLIAGSVGTGWSRIYHNDHYLSQVFLGWAIAYLSVESVNWTEREGARICIVPFDVPRGVGMGIHIEY
jgi:membrane-associated phospholipid phosphatase